MSKSKIPRDVLIGCFCYWLWAVGIILSAGLVTTILRRDSLPYTAPLIPLLVRVVLIGRYRTQLRVPMEEEEKSRSENRTLILALAGFSFTGALGLLAYGTAPNTSDIRIPSFYVFISFICYLFSLNVQSYKALRWHDHIGAGMLDMGTFCLILSVVSMFLLIKFDLPYKISILAFSSTVWLQDLVVRINIWVLNLEWRSHNERHGSRSQNNHC